MFGGEATIDLHGVPPERARAALAALSERFNAWHREWHAWEPGPLTELNAAIARGERSRPPASIRALVLRSQPLSIRSDGLFDPAIGGLMRLWGFHTSQFPIRSPLPTRAQIEAWRTRHPSIADVVVEGDVVWSHNPAVQLDFGGIARHRVPQQESHGSRDDEQDEGAQLAGGVALFVVEVEQRGDDREQDEDFIQVRHRDVADVRPHQVGLVPAHHHAGGAQHHAGPAQVGPGAAAEAAAT